MKRQSKTFIGAAVLAAVLAVGGLSVAAAQGPGSGSRMPAGQGMHGSGGMRSDANRWFIEEMIPHHEGAVVMADLALTQAEHPELKQLAAEIKRVQTDEIAQMRAWYQQWYGTDVPPGRMGGMGHDTTSIDGARPFDKAFIEEMIPHHRQAVMMAQMALQRGVRPELRTLLESIITSQTAEIEQMQQWYQAWYGAPAPRGAGMGGGSGMGGRHLGR